MSPVIWWTSVCGNATEDDAFWSDSISVNTSNPDLTRCFQSTLLAWLPGGYLWLSSLFYVPVLAARPTCSRWADTSRRNAVKLVSVVVS
ncbi:hypothetical protein NP493_1174g00058 [Ridgeia piscesae]|uniref:Uncharacterized protein n=1 Tax=Ridgeia piscesae TaxID=27915 RepID=A0AAD9NJU4_RIDPI|nr:hypothetical protein NP493_1174g00058 [Ridgeia piscesae]